MKKPTPLQRPILFSREEIIEAMKLMEEALKQRIDYLQKEADEITKEIDALVDAEEAVQVARMELKNIYD